MEGEECWNGGGLRPRDRLPGGAGARARRPGNEPAGGAGPLPARPGGVRSWLCGRGRGRARGRRRAVRGPAAGCSRATGGRDWRVRERREGIRLEGFTRA